MEKLRFFTLDGGGKRCFANVLAGGHGRTLEITQRNEGLGIQELSCDVLYFAVHGKFSFMAPGGRIHAMLEQADGELNAVLVRRGYEHTLVARGDGVSLQRVEGEPFIRAVLTASDVLAHK